MTRDAIGVPPSNHPVLTSEAGYKASRSRRVWGKTPRWGDTPRPERNSGISVLFGSRGVR